MNNWLYFLAGIIIIILSIIFGAHAFIDNLHGFPENFLYTLEGYVFLFIPIATSIICFLMFNNKIPKSKLSDWSIIILLISIIPIIVFIISFYLCTTKSNECLELIIPGLIMIAISPLGILISITLITTHIIKQKNFKILGFLIGSIFLSIVLFLIIHFLLI